MTVGRSGSQGPGSQPSRQPNQPRREHLLGVLAALTASAIWGGLYLVSKVALATTPPVTLVCARMIVAALFLWLIFRLLGRSLVLPRRTWPSVLAMGVIGYALSICAQFQGTYLAGAALGSLVTTAAPMVTVVLAALFGHERISLRAWGGLALALVGVAVLAGPLGSGATLSGILWLLVAAFTWGVFGAIGARVTREHDPFAVTFWGSLVGAVVTLPISLLELSSRSLGLLADILTPGLIASVLYLGIVSTAGAFAFWVYGISRAGSVASSLAFFAQPVIGALLGGLLLGEQLGWSFLFGGLLLVIGVFIARGSGERKNLEKERAEEA